MLQEKERKNSIRNRRGMSLRVFILLAAVIVLAFLVFFVPAYLQHNREQRMTFDITSVETLKDVAPVTYLQSGAEGYALYYYDELSHTCLGEDERSTIKGYGRSWKSQNENGETGALGIPNLGDTLSGLHDGQQLLACAIDGDAVISLRWTSNTWSYYDYAYMTDTEKEHLSRENLTAIDMDTVLRGKTAAANEYRNDYKKQIEKQEDPGIAVYNYDPIDDTVTMDEASMEALAEDSSVTTAEIPNKMTLTNAKDLAGYGVSEQGSGTGAYLYGDERFAECLAVIPEMENDVLRENAADTSKNAVLQIYVKEVTTDEGTMITSTEAVWVRGQGYEEDTGSEAGETSGEEKTS